MAVLVDSSVWIASSKASNPETIKLKRLIRDGELICIAQPIQVEVCQGARTETEFKKLWDAFLGFHFLEITRETWGLSAWNYFRCRRAGMTLSTIDCLIATLAATYKIPLWTKDKVFPKAQTLIGFELYE